MPTIYQLKPAFQGLLRPLSDGLAAQGITPNQVTAAALLLSLASGGAIAFWPNATWPLLTLPLVLFLRMALNAIDGMMAREHGLTSPLGAILNEVGDVISDAALYLPFALLPGMAPIPVVLLVLAAAIGEMVGVTSQALGGSRRYDGPLGKSDRAFLFGALGLALGLGLAPDGWLGWLLWVAAALSAYTGVNRARAALREITP